MDCIDFFVVCDMSRIIAPAALDSAQVYSDIFSFQILDLKVRFLKFGSSQASRVTRTPGLDERPDPAVLRETSIRHKFWLKKYAQGAVRADGWRPRPWHRRKAEQWILHTDNQIKVGTPWDGLISFRYDREALVWHHKN